MAAATYTRVCGRCGATNLGQQKQCLICAATLPEMEQIPLMSAQSQAGVCSWCDTPLQAGWHYCPNCGQRVEEEAAAEARLEAVPGA